MAAKEKLYHCHIAVDELCGCYGIDVEFITHVLFERNAAKEVWARSNFESIILEAPSSKLWRDYYD